MFSSSSFYHLLWRVCRRSIIKIEGQQIEYLPLPWWMLVNGPNARVKFGTAQCIMHKPTKTLIILVPNKLPEQRKRLDIYHEYIEGSCSLEIGIAADKADFREQVLGALRFLREDAPNLKDRIVDYSRRTGDDKHAIAILFELVLAKKELPGEAFAKHLEDALSSRL